MQLRLDNIEAELNLAVATRHAELSAALQAGERVGNRQRVRASPVGVPGPPVPSSPIIAAGYYVLEFFGRLDHVGQQLAQFGFLEWRQASVFLAPK